MREARLQLAGRKNSKQNKEQEQGPWGRSAEQVSGLIRTTEKPAAWSQFELLTLPANWKTANWGDRGHGEACEIKSRADGGLSEKRNGEDAPHTRGTLCGLEFWILAGFKSSQVSPKVPGRYILLPPSECKKSEQNRGKYSSVILTFCNRTYAPIFHFYVVHFDSSSLEKNPW